MAAVTAVLVFLADPCFGAQKKKGNERHHGLALAGRYHTDHSEYGDLPFGNGDISYLLAYEYAERIALWQLGADFAPDVSGIRDSDSAEGVTNSVGTKFVVTPQLNLIFKDRMFRGGTGVLTSYIRGDDGEGEWIGPYFQLLLGLSLDLADALSLDGNVHYVLENWDEITHFGFGDLEYSAGLSYWF